MKDKVEVFFHSQQPYTHVTDESLARYKSGRLDFPNTYFDPEKAHCLYNQYHEQYAFADEVGIDGIMTNEHHASYWNMKPSAIRFGPWWRIPTNGPRRSAAAFCGHRAIVCVDPRSTSTLPGISCGSPAAWLPGGLAEEEGPRPATRSYKTSTPLW